MRGLNKFTGGLRRGPMAIFHIFEFPAFFGECRPLIGIAGSSGLETSRDARRVSKASKAGHISYMG